MEQSSGSERDNNVKRVTQMSHTCESGSESDTTNGTRAHVCEREREKTPLKGGLREPPLES
jgi:hypothetical protein